MAIGRTFKWDEERNTGEEVEADEGTKWTTVRKDGGERAALT
jgi:hypothetical protein